MEQDKVRKKSGFNKVFSIQLLECLMVAVFMNLSFSLGGRLIYYDSFPFGFIDGTLMYSMMSALAVLLLGANHYFSFISKPFPETAAKIISLVAMLNFVYIALLYFSKNIQLSFYYFIVTASLQVFALILIKRMTYLLKTNIFQNRVSLVIGKDRKKSQLMKELKEKSLGRLAFASFENERLNEYIDKADNVYVSGLLSKKIKDRIINYCILKDKRIFIVPETYEIAMRKAEMTQVGDIPLFGIESFRLSEAQSFIKRSMDILLAFTGIILSFPLMIYAVIRIKMEDRGPIFYRQERLGLNGKPFHVFKFRSMVVDAEKHTGAVFAAENDPRITRIGRLMRATRIDEIPQFFNVLAGSMSMIGPRPERPQFVEEFSKELPEYAGRLAVKPGITGLAQVMGNYTTSAENKVKFDLVYIRDYSLLLDLKILFKTVKVVLTKEQSKGFSEEPEVDFFDLEATADGAGSAMKKRFGWDHRFGKSVLVMFCCLIVIMGAMFLRYSALAVTMIEAAEQADVIETGLVTDQPYSTADHTEQEQQTADSSIPVEENKSEADLQENVGNRQLIAAAQPEKTQIYLAPRDGQVMTKKRSANQEEVVLSQKEIDTALDKMSLGNKMEVAYKLISRLNAADLMLLEELSEGGFTIDEKAMAKEMMYRYYDAEEINLIKELYNEYTK